MTIKEISNILKVESGIILLKKESEHSFFEALFSHSVSILSFLYFLKRKKFDYLILTENRITLVLQNKVYTERIFNKIEYLNYNIIKNTIDIVNQNQQFSLPLNKLRISHEESKLINQKLAEFKTKATKND